MALTKWSGNKAASMLQGNYDGYIQSSLLQLRLGAAISASATNGAAVYNIQENTTYKVRLYMDTRFRVAACSSIAMNTVMSNYYRDAADKSDTTVAGAYKEAEITSEAGQVYMPVIYWASGGSKTWQEVYNTIEVQEQLSGTLTLKSAPTKTEYNVGEEIDLTGLSVAVAWSDGSEEAVTDYTVSGFDSSSVGTKTVTVTYQGETVTFDVTVVQPVAVTGIEITALPTKVSYLYGEALDTTGMAVKANYSDGTSVDITDYTLSGYDAHVLGEQTITVTYRGFTDTFAVTVANAISGIEVTPPLKLEYAIGDSFDSTGMSVKAVWMDGTKTDITDYTVSGFDSTAAGQKTVTVAYQDFTDTFTVTVAEPVVITGIEIVSLPDKAVYNLGDGFDDTGLVVNAVYSDGSSAAVTSYVLSGFGSATAGTKTITVFYQSFTITFEVTVRNVVKEDIGYPTLSSVTAELDLDTGLLTVSGAGQTKDYANDPVLGAYKEQVKKVVVQDGITSIGAYTFQNLTALKEVTLPESLELMGYNTFAGTTALDTVYYNAIDCKCGWTYNGATYAVFANSGLKKVVLGENVKILPYRLFYLCGSLATLEITGNKLEAIEEGVFVSSALSGELNLDTVKTIGEGAFWGNAKLTGVSLRGAQYIGVNAFQSCASLTGDLVLGSVVTIERGAFHSTILKRIVAGDRIESIGTNAFYSDSIIVYILRDKSEVSGSNWGSYDRFYLPGSSLDEAAGFFYQEKDTEIWLTFTWTQDDDIKIPEVIGGKPVTRLCTDSIQSSAKRKELHIPSWITVIEDGFCYYDYFSYRFSFSYFIIDKPEGSIPGEPWSHYDAKVIWAGTAVDGSGIMYKVSGGEAYVYGFYNPSGDIKNVIIKPEYDGLPVKKIGESAFLGITVDSISLPDGIEDIEDNAFCDCTVSAVNIPGSVRRLGWNSFYNSGITSIKIPAGAEIVEEYVFDCCEKLKTIEYLTDADVPRYMCSENTALERAVISGDVKKIGYFAFGYCSSLTDVVFPDCVEELGGYVFDSCTSLARLPLPKSLRVVGEYCFSDTESLALVEFGTKLREIGAYAFLRQKALTEISFPPSAGMVGEGVLDEGTSLKKITVYNKNMQIPDDAATFQPASAVIHGWTGSTAEAYATKYSRTYVPLDEEIKPVDINIMSYPDKLVYASLDTELDATGLQVGILYNDGTLTPTADYTLSGYDQELGEKTITITYGGYTDRFYVQVMQSHLVTFKDLYGNVLKEEIVSPGGSATPPDVQEIDGFIFSWSNSYENVMADTVCQAQYTVQTYTVEFKDYDGTVLYTATVRYGDDATPPADPARDGYLFTGWSGSYTDVSADTVVTATYAQYAAVTGIDLQASYSVINGEAVNIPYKVFPEAANNKGVSITVSDSTVIDTAYGSGWIICEAINTGTATITVTSIENSSISASCRVTVVADDAVTGISLYPPELLLQKGKTEEIAVSVAGGADADGSVVWTSSNAAVATVKNGKVKGITEGTATITARLKADAGFYATCSVTVEDKKDFIIEAYKKGSLPKPITIHSVNGKFADITAKYIDGESMVIKESICDSQTLKLGGCIANSFEILIQDERLMTKAPEGEIQVYQTIEGNRVDLFNGVIYSAKRIGDSLQRKIVAYDKLYSKGNKDMSAWFKKLKLPMSIKQFRTLLFKKIGIKQASVTLDIDKCMMAPASYKINMPTIDIETGTVVENKKEKIENYTASTSAAKASDIIRDLCEAAGMCGWMNRKGVFEYIDFGAMEVADLDSPISVTCEEGYYSVKCTALKKDDLEWFEGHKEVYVGESVTPDGVIVDAYVQVEYKSEVENATYIMDDNNFIVQIVVVNNPLSKYHLEGLVPIMQAVHSRVSKTCQQFECQRRFNPYIKLGTAVRDEVQKETSEGKLYTWELNSIILSRTIKGSQSMVETISAKNGPFNASNDTSKKNIKTVHVTQELNMKKISMLNNTKLSGVYMTKSEFDAADIQDSNTETYFVRFD